MPACEKFKKSCLHLMLPRSRASTHLASFGSDTTVRLGTAIVWGGDTAPELTLPMLRPMQKGKMRSAAFILESLLSVSQWLFLGCVCQILLR